jgi:hypothetical protein
MQAAQFTACGPAQELFDQTEQLLQERFGQTLQQMAAQYDPPAIVPSKQLSSISRLQWCCRNLCLAGGLDIWALPGVLVQL